MYKLSRCLKGYSTDFRVDSWYWTGNEILIRFSLCEPYRPTRSELTEKASNTRILFACRLQMNEKMADEGEDETCDQTKQNPRQVRLYYVA